MRRHKRSHVTQSFHINTFKDLNILKIILFMKTFLGRTIHNQLASSPSFLVENFLVGSKLVMNLSKSWNSLNSFLSEYKIKACNFKTVVIHLFISLSDETFHVKMITSVQRWESTNVRTPHVIVIFLIWIGWQSQINWQPSYTRMTSLLLGKGSSNCMKVHHIAFSSHYLKQKTQFTMQSLQSLTFFMRRSHRIGHYCRIKSYRVRQNMIRTLQIILVWIIIVCIWVLNYFSLKRK